MLSDCYTYAKRISERLLNATSTGSFKDKAIDQIKALVNDMETKMTFNTNILKKFRGSTLISLCIGNFMQGGRTIVQFAFSVFLKRYLGARESYFYDTVTTDPEIKVGEEFLCKFTKEYLTLPEGTASVVLYMPGCPKSIIIEALKVLSLRIGLKNVLVISNQPDIRDLEEYSHERSEGNLMREKILNASDQLQLLEAPLAQFTDTGYGNELMREVLGTEELERFGDSNVNDRTFSDFFNLHLRNFKKDTL
jgi:hypothetical protein